jgi:hypothetical protein
MIKIKLKNPILKRQGKRKMPSFNNVSDLMNFIKQKTSENLENTVGLKVKEILREYADTLLYQAQEPEDYERTRDLINSITVSKVNNIGNGKFKIYVFFDPSKIIPRETEGNHWNQHMSTDGYNTDESANIPFYMEYGHGGLYIQEPLKFTEYAYKYLNENGDHIRELQRKLNSIGISCNFK